MWSATRGYYGNVTREQANDIEVPDDGIISLDFARGSVSASKAQFGGYAGSYAGDAIDEPYYYPT